MSIDTEIADALDRLEALAERRQQLVQDVALIEQQMRDAEAVIASLRRRRKSERANQD